MSTSVSPYDSATSAAFYSVPLHFRGAAEVWEAYFAGKISQKAREAALGFLRARLLAEVPLPR
jgi:hypothetical protein